MKMAPILCCLTVLVTLVAAGPGKAQASSPIESTDAWMEELSTCLAPLDRRCVYLMMSDYWLPFVIDETIKQSAGELSYLMNSFMEYSGFYDYTAVQERDLGGKIFESDYYIELENGEHILLSVSAVTIKGDLYIRWINLTGDGDTITERLGLLD